MERKLNHVLFSPTRANPLASPPVLAALAAIVLAVSLGANWDRLTKTDEDRFRAAYDAGDFDGALRFAGAIAAASPNDAGAQLRIAATYVQKALAGTDAAASVASARAAALLAGKLDPANPEAWRAVGYTFELEGNSASAITYYQKAVAAAPKNSAALTQLGAALAARGKRDEGQRYIERAVAAEPSDLWARVALARVRVARSDQKTSETEEILQPALVAEDPLVAAEAKAIVSGIRLAAGKSAEAEALAREAASLSPDSAAAKIALGEALYDGVFSRQLPWEETLAAVRALGDRVSVLAPSRVAGPYLAMRAAAAMEDSAAAAAYATKALALLAADWALSDAERAALPAKIRAAAAR